MVSTATIISMFVPIVVSISLFVLLGVVKKKFSYVIYAIFIHAAIDFPLVFFQTGHLKNLWDIELYMAIIGLLSFVFIKKGRNMLPNATR